MENLSSPLIGSKTAVTDVEASTDVEAGGGLFPGSQTSGTDDEAEGGSNSASDVDASWGWPHENELREVDERTLLVGTVALERTSKKHIDDRIAGILNTFFVPCGVIIPRVFKLAKYKRMLGGYNALFQLLNTLTSFDGTETVKIFRVLRMYRDITESRRLKVDLKEHSELYLLITFAREEYQTIMSNLRHNDGSQQRGITGQRSGVRLGREAEAVAPQNLRNSVTRQEQALQSQGSNHDPNRIPLVTMQGVAVRDSVEFRRRLDDWMVRQNYCVSGQITIYTEMIERLTQFYSNVYLVLFTIATTLLTLIASILGWKHLFN